MARSTIVQMTDDLNGSTADESLSFSFRGVDYEIDLSTKNANAMEKALSRYLDAARRIPRSRSPRRGGRAVAPRSLQDVRAWARENGYEVSDRGRIPAEIREAYDATH